MADPRHPSLTPLQLEFLAEAMDVWVAHHPHPDHPTFSFGDARAFSPREAAKAIRSGGPLGERIVRMVRFGAEEVGLENVLARFRGEGVRGRP